MSDLLRLWWYMFPATVPWFSFLGLLVVFIPWPLISVTLAIRFLSSVFAPEPNTKQPLEVYLPRLPAEVVSQVAVHLSGRRELIRFALASRATYHSANRQLYRNITLEEDPSSNIPWFRRRLYRLAQCLTKENALHIRSLDLSNYTDLDDSLALEIIRQCPNLSTVSIPAIQEPLDARFGVKGMLIKQPVFLSRKLAQPIYNSITSLTWIGPFIPFRGPSSYAGRQRLQLFRKLRSLKLIYRPDSFSDDGDEVRCPNIYQATSEDAQSLADDLWCIAMSCTMLEELTLPFWETVYSIAGPSIFKPFKSLQKVHFLALDGRMKEHEYGRGIIKFIDELHQMGLTLTFDNPHRTAIDLATLIDEFDPISKTDCFPSATFGPIGPSTTPWHGRTDILAKLEWITLPKDPNREITLRWPVATSSFAEPQFDIPPLFNCVEFTFNTTVSRADGTQFLKWQKYITTTTTFPNVRKIRIVQERVDAFYLAFPFFMQYKSNRILILHVQRFLVDSGVWIRRRWKLVCDGEEKDVRLEDLGKEDIHVHPARLFERNMFNLMFSGERMVDEMTCIFHDRYSRS
jgi:hypothetical protein